MMDRRIDHPHQLSRLLDEALNRLAVLGQRRVRAEVDGAEVVLKGVVRSYYHKQLAQETVRGIDGVDAIRNEIIVAPSLLTNSRSPVSL